MSNEFTNSLAVIIGINHYQNGISPLQTAVEDACELSYLLKEKHGYTVMLHLDEAATLNQLNQLFLTQLPKTIQPDDRILLYFAGHGIALEGSNGPAGYLIPQDANPADPQSFLAMQALHDALAALPCRHFLGIFDCCFAGAFRWASTRDIGVVPDVIHQERFDRFIEDPAWQVITSAAHDQKALDAFTLKDQRGQIGQHSPFAYGLIRALQGEADAFPVAKDNQPAGDGVITATELYQYLRDSVESNIADQHQQTPGLWPLKKHDKGEYIFFAPGHPLNLPPAPELNQENNPYRGLESFEEKHNHLFFGRALEVETLTKRVLHGHPLTIILGASGTGKSSLVKAGLLPELRQFTQPEFYILPIIRPGETPLATLARACLPVAQEALEPTLSLAALTQKFSDNSYALREIIDIWRGQHLNAKLLIIVDQLEELVTLCRSEFESQRFLELLKFALNAHYEQMHIIGTLRLDFEAQFQTAALKKHWMKARFVISPMTQDELRQAIEGPASERVLYFKPHALVDRLINEVIQMPGALPLLSFTLSELYLKYLERKDGDRALTEEDYETLGGVVGSLTQRATQEYERLVEKDPAYAETIQQAMLRMVSVEGGEVARRRVPKAELVYTDNLKNGQIKEIIQSYSNARLVIEGQDPDGERYVEPAHDAMVRGWDKLLRWRTQNQENLTLQRLVTSATKAWQTNNRNINDLWANNSRLLRLKEIVNSKNNWLNALEQTFTEHSLQRRRNQRLKVVAAISSVIFLLSGSTVWALNNARAAEEERQVATSRQLAAQSDVTYRQKGKFLPRSILLAIQAAKQFPKGTKAPRSDIDQALRKYTLLTHENQRFQHDDEVHEANFSPDGQWVATASADRIVQVWDLKNNRKHFQFSHDGPVQDVYFSHDSYRVATASQDNTVQLWEIENRQKIATFSHQDGVLRVRFSPDDKKLVTASRDKSARIWDTASGQELAKLNHKDTVIEVNFSPGGDRVVTASADTTAQIWDVESGQALHTLDHNDAVWDAYFSPNGNQVATASKDGLVRVWDVKTGKPLNNFFHSDAVWDVRFSPDGKQLVTSSSDRQARIWSLETGKLIQSLHHESQVRDVRWSNDGKKVVTASADGTARLWEVQTGEELLRMVHDAIAVDARFSPDNTQILTTSQDWTARLWDVDVSQEVARFVHSGPLNNVRFSPDGKLLATAGERNIIEIWDLHTQQTKYHLSHEAGIGEIHFSPDGQYLVSASNDSTARLWEVSTGQEVFRMQHDGAVRNVSFSEDGSKIVTASHDKTARIWDVATKKGIRHISHQDRVRDARLSPDGSLIATASQDMTARLWDVASGEELANFKHDDGVWDVRFSPDGTVLATASRDGTGALWNVKNHEKIATLNHGAWVWDVRFSRNGQIVATGSQDGTAKLWDAQTGELIRVLSHDAPVLEVSFSSDSKQVATVSTDQIVQVWDVENGYQTARIAYSGEVWDTRFSPDNHLLATASRTGIARIHYLSTDKLMEEACRRLTRNLTVAEWERYIGNKNSYQRTCPELPFPEDYEAVK